MLEEPLGLKSFLWAAVAFAMTPVYAQQSSEEIAQKLVNPVAAMISVPIQSNYDENIGKAELGKRWTINVQPVIPIEINSDWNLISRAIIPVVSQKDIFAGSGSQFGLSDMVLSAFFSPKATSASGWMWGVGPVLSLPTGTNDLLGTGKWGAGPTTVFLKQQSGWTFGALANHVWSFAGDGAREGFSATYLQPFLVHTTKSATTFAMNTESTYDWKSRQWTVPINATVTQLLKVGDQRLSVGGGIRYWAHGPDGAPHGWGARLLLTFVFPK